MNRRLFLLLSVASACISPLVAQAAAFPDKPIRIIVPYAPGGTTDMLARVVGKHMSDNLGQSVIVENKPGANGMLGSSMAAKSTTDGYTLGVASPANHAANASLYKEVPSDTITHFTSTSHAEH